MRLVIQRVKEASVAVDGKEVSRIGRGLFILVGVEVGDTEADMEWLAAKAAVLQGTNWLSLYTKNSVPVFLRLPDGQFRKASLALICSAP